MVLNLETFDRLVFHGQYFTAVFKQTLWHPCPRAAELSTAKRAEPCGIKQMTSFHTKLEAKGYFTTYQRRSFKVLFFSNYMIIVGSRGKILLLPPSDSCGFELLLYLLCSNFRNRNLCLSCTKQMSKTRWPACLVQSRWARQDDLLELKIWM